MGLSDEWSSSSENSLALFADYIIEGVVKMPFLSLAPIINEPNDDLNARTQYAAIKTMFGFFDKEEEQCAFVVGDNCSVNELLVKLLLVPLLGCASHRST